MHLFPAMETASLTQRAHSVGEGMVQIMEEHLVETMSATQQEGHRLAEHWITAGGILRQELVPPMGMVEVGEECPGDGEASSASDGHRQEETPALREGPSKWPGAKEPHTGPKACYEKAIGTHLPQKSLLHLPPAPWSGKLAYQRKENKAPVSLAPIQCHTGTNGTVNQPYHLSVHSCKTYSQVAGSQPNSPWTNKSTVLAWCLWCSNTNSSQGKENWSAQQWLMYFCQS